MEQEKLKQEYHEWITKIRLAHCKRFGINIESLENNDKAILLQVRQLLIEDGIPEETINQEVVEYESLSEEDKTRQIEEKVKELVTQINTYLENIDEINSEEYPELYYRIQELVVLSPKKANELINEAFGREKINNCMNCNGSLYGKPCTYYFSKKLSYK